MWHTIVAVALREAGFSGRRVPSLPAQVNTRRSRCDNKNEGPSLNDTLGKLRGIGGRFQKVLAERRFHTGIMGGGRSRGRKGPAFF